MTTGQTILIVDDDKDTADLLQIILENTQRDFQILVTNSGQKAIELCQEHAPDLVLLDIMMPVMDGFETYRQIRKLDTRIPPSVFFLTARAERHDVLEGFKLGADDYIEKPFDPAILIQKVISKLQKDAMLKKAVFLDPLTEVYNNAYLEERLNEFCKIATRYDKLFSVAFIDLDNFKPINDTYGHATGDEYLKNAAAILLKVFRQADVVARYGGDEFCVIMPETDLAQALEAAKRLENYLEKQTFDTGNKQLRVQMSCGVAEYGKNTNTPRKLLKQADKKMYEHKTAKKAGR